MKYIYSLLIRCLLCFLIIFASPFLFTWVTIQTSYFFLLPLDVILVGNLLFVKGMAFKFVEACVASLAYSLIFILVMLTSDLNLRKRVLIILTGWLLIFVMNVMRIIVLVSVAVNHSEELFKSLDIVIWLGISGVFVALVWIALVWLYDIKSIPVYNDIKFLMKNSYFSK